MKDQLSDILPEERLLLSSCRLDFTGQQKQEIGDWMLKVTDWNYFVRLANEHGIIALAWHNMSLTVNQQIMPDEIFQKLHAAYLKSLSYNTFVYNQLEEVASLLVEDNISIVILKGLALEETVYGNRGLRQMTDIDVLVKKEDALKMRKILLENGYESSPIISPVYERKMFQHGKHLPEMNKNGLSVEIHTKLFAQPGNSMTEEFIEKAYPVPGKKNIYFPESQLFFLYLVKHLDRHEKEGTSQLKLYVDLYLLLMAYTDQILNERLFQNALKVNLVTALGEKLYILGTFWGMFFPEWVKSFSGKTNTETAEEKFIWFLRHPNENQPRAEPGSMFNSLKEIPGVLNKTLLIIGYIFPSISFIKYHYKVKSKARAVCYYPAWWGRICGMLIRGRRKGKT